MLVPPVVELLPMPRHKKRNDEFETEAAGVGSRLVLIRSTKVCPCSIDLADSIVQNGFSLYYLHIFIAN